MIIANPSEVHGVSGRDGDSARDEIRPSLAYVDRCRGGASQHGQENQTKQRKSKFHFEGEERQAEFGAQSNMESRTGNSIGLGRPSLGEPRPLPLF